MKKESILFLQLIHILSWLLWINTWRIKRKLTAEQVQRHGAPGPWFGRPQVGQIHKEHVRVLALWIKAHWDYEVQCTGQIKICEHNLSDTFVNSAAI